MRSIATTLFLSFVLLSATGALTVAQSTIAEPTAATEQTTYAIDNAHTSTEFKVAHLGISWVSGRFNDVAGKFSLDANQLLSSLQLTIQVKSIDTKNEQRNGHLRSADFSDAEQFPEIVFASTAVKPTEAGLSVTGNVTMHGVTRPQD